MSLPVGKGPVSGAPTGAVPLSQSRSGLRTPQWMWGPPSALGNGAPLQWCSGQVKNLREAPYDRTSGYKSQNAFGEGLTDHLDAGLWLFRTSNSQVSTQEAETQIWEPSTALFVGLTASSVLNCQRLDTGGRFSVIFSSFLTQHSALILKTSFFC